MSQTSERLKIGGYSRQHIKDHIYASMEVVQGTRTCRHHLRCIGCEAKCDLHFMTRGALRSVCVGKTVAAFYSLCKNLGRAEESQEPDGLLSLLSDVNEEK